MRVAYFDCFSGISGDMILGALLDCGIDHKKLFDKIYDLPIDFEVELKETSRSGLRGIHVKILSKEKKVSRSWQNIEKIIQESPLDLDVKQKSLKILNLLVDTESAIHGMPKNKVHLHEIGAVDTIIDIVGAVQGLKLLAVDEIYCSPIATGYGIVKSEHGTLPVPSPATIEILKDVPIYSGMAPTELTTPTGAAIIKTVCGKFGEMPMIMVDKIGYGAGERDIPHQPNLLRLLVGDVEKPAYEKSNLLVISANIDDLNPEHYGNLIDQLLLAGAKDAWLSPISMKKGRQGICVSALVDEPDKNSVLEKLFREGSTLGARVCPVERHALPRKTIKVKVEDQEITVKIGYINDEPVNIAPEHDDCQKASAKTGTPLKIIYQKAIAEAQKNQ